MLLRRNKRNRRRLHNPTQLLIHPAGIAWMDGEGSFCRLFQVVEPKSAPVPKLLHSPHNLAQTQQKVREKTESTPPPQSGPPPPRVASPQWWSNRATHFLQVLQCFDLAGREKTQVRQALSGHNCPSQGYRLWCWTTLSFVMVPGSDLSAIRHELMA